MFPTLSQLHDELHASSLQKGPEQEMRATLATLLTPWLRDGLHVVDSAEATGDLAAAADPTQEVILVPAFVGLGAPHWRRDARASNQARWIVDCPGTAALPDEFQRPAADRETVP